MFSPELPAALKKLILNCLNKNPKERAKIAQLATDAWVTNDGTEPLVLASLHFPNVDKEEVDQAIAERVKDKPSGQ